MKTLNFKRNVYKLNKNKKELASKINYANSIE